MAKQKKNFEPKPGWAIYLRTSDKESQNPENSQRRQRHAIQRTLLDDSKLPIYGEYVDNLSGRFAGNRNGYQQMLEDARAGLFSHVAVENAERFGRNDAEALPVIDELHALGIAVRFADYPELDPIDPDDRILVSLSFTLARRESIKIGQRAKGGMYAKMRVGGFIGVAPDGYINCEKRTGVESRLQSGRYTRWIELDPEQAKVWRLAWDLLLTDRYTLAQICEELHARGYRFRTGTHLVKITRTGKRSPQTNRLSKIFHNWTYAGWVVSEKAEIPPKTIQGQWEPLVTTEEFEHGLAILDRRNQKPENHYIHHYLLKGLIYLHQEDELVRLTCATPNPHRKSGGTAYYCVKSSNINLLCSVLDERVGNYIRSIQIEQQLVPILREHYSHELAEKLGLIRPDENRRVKEALQEIDKEEERTLRLFAAGRVTEEIWNNLWREWQDRRQKLLDRQAILGRQQTYHVSNLDAALNLISKIGVLYDGLDLIQKKQLLREIVERVVVNAEGEILRIELLPPFTYLTNLSHQMQVVEDGNWARNEKTSLCAGCSTCATLCVPDGIQSEHLSTKTTSQFLQQLTFPQSAALLHLSNKLQF